MRIALDAMGGDHAPGPIVAGAVQAVAADRRAARRPGRRPGPDRAAPGGHGAVPRSPRPLPLHAGRRPWKRRPSWPCARSRTTPSAAAGSSWPSARSRPSSAPATPGPWSPAACSCGASSRTSAGPASPPSCRPCAGPCVLLDVGANVSPKPEHLFQYGVMGSIFARHILQRAAARPSA